MNYFLLAETDFFRRINEAGDCNMEKAYTAFATQVIELCIGSPVQTIEIIGKQKKLSTLLSTTCIFPIFSIFAIFCPFSVIQYTFSTL